MNTKFLGGTKGGTKDNAGSCRDLAEYLEHDKIDDFTMAIQQGDEEQISKMISKGKIYIETYFFDLVRDDITREEVIAAIDGNHSKLGKNDTKFYHHITAPSANEIMAMGNSDDEKIKNFRYFIRSDVIDLYASNFKREIRKEDLLFFAKIHLFRNTDNGNILGMHCHKIQSRKSNDGKKKLSPLSNHRSTTKGAVKGGFDRVFYYNEIERRFDKRFNYKRKFDETFEYLNAMKNGSAGEKLRATEILAAERVRLLFESEQKKKEIEKLERTKKIFNKNMNYVNTTKEPTKPSNPIGIELDKEERNIRKSNIKPKF